MKRVILTGANGFVGRQIAMALLARGHQVTGVVRRASVAVTGLQTIETDDLFAMNQDWWARQIAGADALIHAAWYVKPGLYLDSRENLRCVTGSLPMARAARSLGLQHFIGIGTCMEYRLPSDQLGVNSPLGPNNLYAESKLALFRELQKCFAGSQTNLSWARLFYLHGEGEHPDRLVPYIKRQLAHNKAAKLSSGVQLRDFLDVADAGRLIAEIVDTGQAGAINVCSGQAVTVRHFAEQIADRLGKRDLLEFGTASAHPSDPLAVVGICNATRVAELGENR